MEIEIRHKSYLQDYSLALMDEVVIESEVKQDLTDGVVSKSVPPSTRVSSHRRGSRHFIPGVNPNLRAFV